MTAPNTVDAAEIEKFSRMSSRWWDPEGPFRPLHRLNPARLSYIRDRVAAHFGRDPRAIEPFSGLRALDIGCGGGLVAEPLARMGAKVTAIDADANAIDAAETHAQARTVTVDYRIGNAEALVDAEAKFDLVLALEIIEHVADHGLFLDMLGHLVAPGGMLILSTLNRTLKSRVLGIGVAEHILRWVEPGTHDWRKFVKPSELARGLRAIGFETTNLTGLVFDPLRNEFRLSPNDVDVNYFAAAVRRV
ncbi:MAG TPA: bifunctional 2-polyprenyl-6-hydroxyphenol methylase/3-demethylubiquinol 3-O-methyltransferase UbiG [Alphaproteobacteria bacterium]|nr:bifunctional 2-polyprenyl-6-hydroxyphenol methylase/3-demethylubiquinol 3-O-methyltransferase UbiG [Alphaproteobacteria bacterium]